MSSRPLSLSATAVRLLSLLVLLSAGCDSGARDASAVDYGDPYGLRTEGDAVARLADGRVLVPVEYGGGCAEHTFALRSRLDGGTATVWYEHDANGDACEALLVETLDAALPASAAAADRVVLRVPRSLTRDDEVAVDLR